MGLPGKSVWLLGFALLPLRSFADPAKDVEAAVTKLTTTSFAWETTTRQRFTGDSVQPRLDASAPLEMEGKSEANGYSEVTIRPSSKGIPVPVTAFFRAGDVVGQTPLGWLHRTEMRNQPGPDRMIEFEGKQVRLSRALGVALRATAELSLTEQLFNLLADVKSYSESGGLILGELRDGVIEKLWNDPQARRAPEVQGTVIFKVGPEGLSEYHVLLAIGFPNSRTKRVSWTMQQWSTRIRGIGSTRVSVPAEAAKRLND